jgi:hypothetical protein
MELVGNLWPVVDAASGLVQRFFMRGYAMQAADSIISQTLNALAPSDYLAAQVFHVPQKYCYTSEHGTLKGCVPIADFHLLQSGIIEEAMREVEAGGPKFLGIQTSEGGVRQVGVKPRFPNDPYFVVTMLLETAEGHLLPQL